MNALAIHEQGKLEVLETKIATGLQTFVEVGTALLEIRDGRLYRQWHSTFEDYCDERWGIKRQRAYELMDAAAVVANLSEISDKQSIRESHVAPLARLEPEIQPIAWSKAIATAPNGKVTAAHVEATVRRFVAPDADEQLLEDLPSDEAGYDWTVEEPEPVSDEEPKDGDEYYTPKYLIEAARAVLGAIELDPASCELAQKIVQARRYFDKETNGLDETWRGQVWLNPPFSEPRPFVFKAIEEYENGNISEAILLVNNGTETSWGQALLARFPVCFVGASEGRGSRIAFWNKDPDQPQKGNRYAQMICYLGEDPQRFFAVFSRFGPILEPRCWPYDLKD